jgi:hypothetical protein
VLYVGWMDLRLRGLCLLAEGGFKGD